jgi:hypothetical protein
VAGGTDEEALLQMDCRPYCLQPRVRRKAKVEEHPELRLAPKRSRLVPNSEADEERKPSCLEEALGAQAAYLVEACPDGTGNRAEEDTEDSRLAAGSTGVAERG